MSSWEEAMAEHGTARRHKRTTAVAIMQHKDKRQFGDINLV